MSSVATRSRWRFLITPRWLAWHAFAVVAFWGMLWLGDWQFHRAEGGNALSWAYTFEWPIFAVMGAVFWAKTIIDEAKPKLPEDSDGEEAGAVRAEAAGAAPSGTARSGAAAAALPGSARLLARRAAARAQAADADDADDPDLDEYNAYLARLNQQVQGHGRWHGLR